MRTALAAVPLLALAASPGLLAAQTPLTFSGQMGFRVEYMGNENFAATDATRADNHRMRWRVRVRLGAAYVVSEQVALGFRLSTGSSSYPSSGWSSLNDDFRRDGIAFDRAYLSVQPNENIRLRFGFDANPLFRPTELVWDDDVSPGGMSLVARTGDVEIVAGQFMLREVRSLRPDNQSSGFLFAHGVTYRAPERNLRLGAYHYAFHRPDVVAQAIDDGQLDADYMTNRFDPADPSRYWSGYHLLGVGLSWTANAWSVAADIVVNLAATSSTTAGASYAHKENTAVGGMVRRSGRMDGVAWSVGGGFFHIEADAVIAAYNSDDLQQTNVNSLPIEGRLGLPNGATLVWDSYLQKKINTDLASNGGLVHGENAMKIRTRISVLASF